MGGLMSRNKGKSGEREVIKLLQPVLDTEYQRVGKVPPTLRRNLMQSYKGIQGYDNHDLVGLEWLALEVKRQEANNVNSWWEQAVEQAGEGKEPVLFYRKNNAAWKVRMYGFLIGLRKRVQCPVDIDVESFLAYLSIRVAEKLQEGAFPAK